MSLKINKTKYFWIFNDDKTEVNNVQHYLNIINEHIHWIEKKVTPKITEKITDNNDGKYICKFCGRQFGKGYALGGHISKCHSKFSLKGGPKSDNMSER
jgi:hypothetical protein